MTLYEITKKLDIEKIQTKVEKICNNDKDLRSLTKLERQTIVQELYEDQEYRYQCNHGYYYGYIYDTTENYKIKYHLTVDGVPEESGETIASEEL